MIKIIDNNFDVTEYNQKAIHPLQSWQWGEARKKMGIEVLRVGEYVNNKLKDIFQMTIHQLPIVNYKIGYLPRSVFPSNDVLRFLYDWGKKNKLLFIKIEPYEIKNPVGTKQSSQILMMKSSHPLFPDWTQIIDLTKTEDELLKGMKSKTRYNVKLAQKKGIVVKEMSNDEGFEIFSKLYFETCKRQKYFGHTPHYHRIVWDNLKNNIGHILVAFYNKTPLAVYELFLFNKTFYYPYGGSSLEYKNLMAANLLMWEAIRLGKKLGASKFDMWGSLGPDYDQNNSWAGFTRFKEGYGTSFTEMIGSYDLVVRPLYYSWYNFIYRLRSFYLHR
jgi:lipid II:glycine glycyltransferase (peptidoglycan interpeptide bridge formation enzyme)